MGGDDEIPDGPYKHLRGMLYCFWNMPDLDGDVVRGLYDVLMDGGEDAVDQEYDDTSDLVWRLCGM